MALALVSLISPEASASSIRRIVAIGDLHGDYSAWRDITRAARLVDDKGRWIGRNAIVVQVGDVVDRGPNSLQIILDLMRLQREAIRARGQVIVLVGNHEAMNLTGDLRYVTAADYASLTDDRSPERRESAYAANKALIEETYRRNAPDMTAEAIKQAWIDATPLGAIEHRIAWSPTGEIGRWIVGNPAIVLLDGNLFVHGGISPAYANLSIVEINKRVAAALIAQDTEPRSIINDPLGPLWYRGLAISVPSPLAPSGEKSESILAPVEPLKSPSPEMLGPLNALGALKTVPSQPASPSEPSAEDQVAAVLSAYEAERIVIGHTPVLSGIAILYGGRLICIDTGISAVFGGKVTYLDIREGNPVPRLVERSSLLRK